MNPGTTPFFSVVIFTKNRSDIVGFALESVLQQSFSDFEVIISDNDDTDATSKALAQYSDPRMRYFRTNGKLSMVDNWEFGLSKARGEYVLSLTDRSALKSYALERIKSAIDEHQEDVYVWSHDLLYDSLDHVSFCERHGTAQLIPSRQVFNLFLTKQKSDQLPKGLNSCHSKHLLQKIRDSTGGRLSLPAVPDYNFAFLTLSHSPRIVWLDEPLFVWGYGHLSNGGGLYQKSNTFTRFLNDIGLKEEDLFAYVPIKTNGVHNIICNDLMKLKQAFPDRFVGVDLEAVSYFVTCRQEINQWLEPEDPLFSEKVAAWENALALQPKDVREKIKASIAGFEGPVAWYRKVWRAIYSSSLRKKAHCRLVEWREQSKLPPRPKKFTNILEAVRWIELGERMKGEGPRGSEPVI
jgi:glycosyltransferase involved in cell wall biosynthesis